MLVKVHLYFDENHGLIIQFNIINLKSDSVSKNAGLFLETHLHVHE